MSGAKDAKRIFPLNRRIGTTPQPEGWTTSENDSQGERGRRLSRLAALGLSGPPLSGRSYNLVQNEHLRGEITAQLAFERSLRLGGTQGVDDVNGVSKQDAVALLASSVAQSGSQVGLPKPTETQEDDIGFLVDEG